MSKSRSLPAALKSIVKSQAFKGAPLPGPLPAPPAQALTKLFQSVQSDASRKGLGYGEWLSLATATLITLNASASLQALHRFAIPAPESSAASSSTTQPLSIADRVNRACLMREVGLKLIGFIGIPKVINNLAALRAAVDEDAELAKSLPTEARRALSSSSLPNSHKAGYALWDDIYQPHSSKLISILARSHPDLPVFIVESEYGGLFALPSSFSSSSSAVPDWEVDRLRTSLTAIAALRAQGGVAPQVTSHIWGLLKAKDSIVAQDPHSAGKKWLASEEGAQWAIGVVDYISEQVRSIPERESKL